MKNRPIIAWFRHDLRLEDNPALYHASKSGSAVVPVFIWTPREEEPWAPGAASRVWLHHSLQALGDDLGKLGSRLILRQGATIDVMRALVEETGAGAVFWNRRYEPTVAERDKDLERVLRDAGVNVQTFNASLLFEPWEIENKSGNPYKVFTPFWKMCMSRGVPSELLPSPKKLSAPKKWPGSLSINELNLLPEHDWDKGIRETWTPGEDGAQDRLRRFVRHGMEGYSRGRDEPALETTSRLSPHLHFGEIGPRQVWHAIQHAGFGREEAAAKFLSELGWREFSHHLLHHFPGTSEHALREEFRSFPWERDDASLEAWQHGRTGYPIVDAGMRELWDTGWMHNRVRMIVASFLTKDLLLPWQEGARWFWDTLVDADLANNSQGWQWTAGCGADAAPYFRIFNPVSQGEKFDAQGEYVRRWAPELARVPDKFIHKPWEAPEDVLNEAGVVLGKTYPRRIIDHSEARMRALDAYETVKKNR